MPASDQPTTWSQAPLANKIAVIVAAVTIPLTVVSCGFIVFAGDEAYSAESAANCVSDKGYAVGSPYELGGAMFFVGSPTSSTVSERQFVVSIQDSEKEAVDWQGFWDTQASPEFTATSLRGRSVVGWRYEPPTSDLSAVTDCLR